MRLLHAEEDKVASVEKADGLSHYAVLVLDAGGGERCGYDYREASDAEEQRLRLEGAGLRVEVWARDAFGRRLRKLTKRTT